MNKALATTALAAVIGLASTVAVTPVKAADAMEKCFGIAARGHNDCAAGAHSCAGNATIDRDPASFVALPKGACGKIAGGKLSPA
jgi:uncharacterized membrane protein